MTADINKEKSPGGKEPVMTEKIARGRILLIEGGKDGIVALDKVVRDLDGRVNNLREERSKKQVVIENMKASGFFGAAKAFLGGAMAGLQEIEAELEPLIQQIQTKSAKTYRGIVEVENIVDRFMNDDKQYKIAEVMQQALQKVRMMASLCRNAVHSAQVKVEGALTAGSGEEAAQMIGTDIELYTEKYNKVASQALQAIKTNAESLHKALREYSSHAKEAPGWKVDVAIDAESVLSVDLLTNPHYLDVYTPKKLEEIKVQLHMLNDALTAILEQVDASYKKLQEEKKAYILAKKNKLCDHLFTEKDKDYHKKRAQGTWGTREPSEDGEKEPTQEDGAE